MNWHAVGSSFALVAVSEMGDKTQLLAFSLAGRFRRPWVIMAGILVATVVNHALASTVGVLVASRISPRVMATVLAVTFFAFGLSKISFIQFFGIGTGIAILIDATIVRGVLVPAVMRLVGEPIWWAPRPLRRLHDRFGLQEKTEDDPRGTLANVEGR